MAPDTYAEWKADGSPWEPARPIEDLSNTLRQYGYTVYVIGNLAHLQARPPQDHTPYSATGWPQPSPYPVVHAMDIMAPAVGSGLPGLSQLGAQLYLDKTNNVAPWIKYMNWEPQGPGGPCYHDAWEPNHSRTASNDRGHIHVSIRTDYTHSHAATNYDPVARLRPPPPPVPKPTLGALFIGEPMAAEAFVAFYADAETDPDQFPDALPVSAEIFSHFGNGMVRATLPPEWNNRSSLTPVWRAGISQLGRYKTYDYMWRDPDLDSDD